MHHTVGASLFLYGGYEGRMPSPRLGVSDEGVERGHLALFLMFVGVG